MLMNLTTRKNLLIILFVLVNCSIVNASEIVSLQSLDIKPYNNALSGFEHACNCDVKRLVVSEMHGMDIVKKIHKEKPEIILAIGIEALKRVGGIENIPVIYLMVLSPESVVAGKDNITGISLYITPQRQLAVIKQALPDVSSIGLLYDPARTGDFVKKARRAAAAEGIELIDNKTHNSKNVPALLKDMKGKIDAFWMLPDLTVITPETVELLLLFSIENGIAVVTFSDNYLEMGALMSLNIDPHDIGKQAWEIVKMVLSGTDVKEIAMSDARKADVAINLKTATKMGITLGITTREETLSKAGIIDRK